MKIQDGFLHLWKLQKMKYLQYSLKISSLIFFLFFFGTHFSQEKLWQPYDETLEIAEQQNHTFNRMKYKLIQSKYLDKNEVFMPLYKAVAAFPEIRYETLLPLILEQDIPTIQGHIKNGVFTYEELTLFYLKRIYKYELNPKTSLHTIIALNPNVLEEAKALDKNKKNQNHPIYGMPILLKDNINTKGMKTTAGSVALVENSPKTDAFIVSQLRKKGALILGKVNLSEWAYYFCNGCPVGYSAIGGQTLNPYGRKKFETGGSSAGSGTAVAANYAVAAVGTETAGSIISPSSQNSIVGLKPTVGLLSRSGIVPISHTLDTPGPMTKNVTDTAILLDAMTGKDYKDAASVNNDVDFYSELKFSTLKGKRLGVMKSLISDSIYSKIMAILKNAGAILIEYTPEKIDLPNFLTLLNLEMKVDLPVYLEKYTSENITVKNLEEVMAFNKLDSLKRMPYNQGLFDGIMKDTTSEANFVKIKYTLKENGTLFFEKPIKEHNLDAILSINNYHSAYAAVALYPCLTVPMGYKSTGEPIGLTFIAPSFEEKILLQLARAFEKENPLRKIPSVFLK